MGLQARDGAEGMRYPKPTRKAKAGPQKLARTSRPRRKRKGKRASIARECDRLWSLIVRSKGYCEGCGKSGSACVLQGAHGFSRRYRATRWNLLNGFALCSGDHVRWTHDPLGFDQFLRLQWGDMVYSELRYLALKNEKQDMPAVLARLREEANRLGIE